MAKNLVWKISVFVGLFFCAECIFAERSVLDEFENSARIEKILSSGKIEFISQSLAPDFAGNFARNFIVENSADKNSAETAGNKSAVQNVIFVFSADFFLDDSDFCLDFIRRTKEKKLPYATFIVFAAGSETFFLPPKEEPVTGCERLVERIFENEKTCAVLIRDKKNSPPFISTEGSGTVSPQWLVQSVKKSFDRNQTPLNVKSSIFYFYKPEAYKVNRNLSAFLGAEIPAVEIPLGKDERDQKILSSIQDNLVSDRRDRWNKHYNFFPAANGGFWMGESLIAAVFIVLPFFALFSICFASFSANGKNEAMLKDFSRTWFVIPLHLLFTSIFFTIFQNIFAPFQGNMEIYFSLKIFPSVFCLFCLIFFQVLFEFKTSLSASNYCALISAALNIFIFTAVDLSLMFVFMIEYLLIFIFQKRTNIFLILLSMILMTLPFTGILISVFVGAEPSSSAVLIKSNFSENVLLSFVLLPFLFQWEKFAIVFSSKKSAQKISTKIARGIFAGALFSAAIFFTMRFNFFPFKKMIQSGEENSAVFAEENSAAEISVSAEEKFSLAEYSVKIFPAEGFKIARCRIFLENDEIVPFYSCNFDYEILDETKTQIKIPDFPADEIKIVFTCEKNSEILLDAEIFSVDDSGRIFCGRKKISAGGGDEFL
jgi:hypothetical protein